MGWGERSALSGNIPGCGWGPTAQGSSPCLLLSAHMPSLPTPLTLQPRLLLLLPKSAILESEPTQISTSGVRFWCDGGSQGPGIQDAVRSSSMLPHVRAQSGHCRECGGEVGVKARHKVSGNSPGKTSSAGLRHALSMGGLTGQDPNILRARVWICAHVSLQW